MLPPLTQGVPPMARENLPTVVADLKARMQNIRDSL